MTFWSPFQAQPYCDSVEKSELCKLTEVSRWSCHFSGTSLLISRAHLALMWLWATLGCTAPFAIGSWVYLPCKRVTDSKLEACTVLQDHYSILFNRRVNQNLPKRSKPTQYCQPCKKNYNPSEDANSCNILHLFQSFLRNIALRFSLVTRRTRKRSYLFVCLFVC